jgi:hypothetical protein
LGCFIRRRGFGLWWQLLVRWWFFWGFRLGRGRRWWFGLFGLLLLHLFVLLLLVLFLLFLLIIRFFLFLFFDIFQCLLGDGDPFELVLVEMVSVTDISQSLHVKQTECAHPSKSVRVRAFCLYSASRISLYANGIFAGAPSKNVSLNGKIYES